MSEQKRNGPDTVRELDAAKQHVVRLSQENAQLRDKLSSTSRTQKERISAAVKTRLDRAAMKHSREVSALEATIMRRDQTIAGLRQALNNRKDQTIV